MRGARVVVAGAGGDLALAFLEALAEAGVEPILVGRNAEALTERADRFGARSYVADLADPLSTEALAEAVGPVDGAIHLAGAFAAAPVRATDPALYHRMIEANLSSLFFLARALLPGLAEREGFLVGVSAAAGWNRGGRNLGAYAAAKAGVLALLGSIRAEEPRVRVLALVPMAAIDTPRNRRAMPEADPSKWIRPEALARAALHALSLSGGRVFELPVYPPGA